MRSKLLVGAGILGVLALLSGVAMACVPSASIRLSPPGGPTGTKVTVTGSTFDPAGSPVNIYWDGTRGTFLASVPVQPDRTMSYTFTVPAGATGGTHLVSATQRDSQGQSYNPVNATFSVSGSPRPATAPNLQGPARPQQVATPAPAGQPSPAPAGQPSPAPAGQPSAQAAAGQAPAAVAPGAQPPAGAPPAQVGGLPGTPPPAGPVADGSTQPATASDAFRTPAASPSGATTPGSEGTPAWMIGGLAALALGLFGAGTGIFAAERRRTRVSAEAE